MVNERENQKRLEAAKYAAIKAGKMLVASEASEVHSKGWHDFVTEMDLESEKIIIDYLSKRFPTDNFFSEERGGNCDSGTGLWIIDPIDGTGDFIHDIPCYTISIAYRNSSGELSIGVIYNPRQRELFWAGRGIGAFLNRNPIHVSCLSDPSDAYTIMSPHPRLHKEAPFFFNLMKNIFLVSMDLRNFGSAALHLAYVACGRVDAFLHQGLKLYDIAAGLVILNEAGGRYSGFLEDENVIETGNLVATNGALHDWYISQIRCGGFRTYGDTKD